MSGMHSLIVVMSWHDAFHIGTIDTFIADVQLWQRCYGQPLWSQWLQIIHCNHLKRPSLLRFPVTLALTRLHMGTRTGTLGSCLKALQPAAGGRCDPHSCRVEQGLCRMLQNTPCTVTGFQGLGSFFGRQQWPCFSTQSCSCKQISLRFISEHYLFITQTPSESQKIVSSHHLRCTWTKPKVHRLCAFHITHFKSNCVLNLS